MGGADILRLQAQGSLALSCSEADTVKSPVHNIPGLAGLGLGCGLTLCLQNL